MDGRLRGDGVVVGGDARQRLHDARGYGRPRSGNEVLLSCVEAAHLLLRGDLDAVDGMEFRAFLSRAAGEDPTGGFGPRFLVYADLRGRGFYLSPDRAGWVPDPGEADFVVYPRGSGPGDGAVAYRVRVAGERATVPAADLDWVLAVVDEESEITYLEAGRPDLDGGTAREPPAAVAATLLGDRVVAWNPPADLHDRGFYGQPLTTREGEAVALQLSLVEAASLAGAGALAVEGAGESGAVEAVLERGRAVEGERFDRRLAVYRALRDRGLVPKTGFKFGADFRVYREFESVSEVGHSELLVRVLPRGHEFSPRDLALDVRLAHGVRKRMTFALVDGDDVEWLSVERLTP